MYCANVVLLNLVHQSRSDSKIKKLPRCLATSVGITNNYTYTYNYALSYHYKFQNILMGPFEDIDYQSFWGP